VFVQSPKARSLARLLKKEGAQVTDLEDGLDVVGRTAADIGELAAREGIALHQLRTEAASLEDVFLELTGSEGGIR
jgi:ABC-2 type transport system ATP-binding protein